MSHHHKRAVQLAKYVISMLKNELSDGIYLRMAIQYARLIVIHLMAISEAERGGRSFRVEGGGFVDRGVNHFISINISTEPINIIPYKDDAGRTAVIMSSYDITGVDEMLTFKASQIPDIIRELNKIHEESKSD